MRVALLSLILVGCTENNLVPADDPNLNESPSIVVDPPFLDLGEVLVGETVSGVFTITNVGGAELRVDDVLMTRFKHKATITLHGTPLLPPEGSVDVTVEATAKIAESDDGIVRIESNDPRLPNVDLPVTLAGLPLDEPAIRIDPLVYDFGVVSTSVSQPRAVTVTNVGGAPLTVTGLAWASSSTSELRLASDGKLTAGAVLAAGESRELEVRYSPDDDVADEASLVVYSDDPLLPEANANFFGDGEVVSDTTDHDVEIWITADDEWTGTLDGVDVTGPNAAGWGACDTITEVLPTGEHVLAVHAFDTASAISGFVAVVKVDGKEHLLTGDPRVRMSSSKPSSGWESPTFDDSSWTTPDECRVTSMWGGQPAALFAEGAAKWVWSDPDCTVLGEAWFRVPITLP